MDMFIIAQACKKIMWAEVYAKAIEGILECG